MTRSTRDRTSSFASVGASSAERPWTTTGSRLERFAAYTPASACSSSASREVAGDGRLLTPTLIVIGTGPSRPPTSASHPLGEGPGLVQRGVGHEERELLAADPRDDVRLAGAAAQGVADLLEDGVALGVP